MASGISIFKEGADLECIFITLDFAFKEDSTILVEEFIEGTNTAFCSRWVSKQQFIAQRLPMLIGMDRHTIKELSRQKK